MISLLLFLTSPILTTLPEGRLDWTARALHVVGAARPEILSPTGDRTLRPAYPEARADAFARMERLLAMVPFDHKQQAHEALPPEALARAVKRAEAQEPLRFSDGSQHLHLKLPFAFMTPGVEGPLNEGPSGLLIRMEGEPTPAARLTLKDDEGRVTYVGAVGDRLNGGVIWVNNIKDARAHVGRQPRKIHTTPLSAPGAFLVKDAPDIFAPEFTFVGGVAVWIKPPAKKKKRKKKGRR